MQAKDTITQLSLAVENSDKHASILFFIVKEINESRVIMKGRHLNNSVLLRKGILRQIGCVEENYSEN